MSAAAKTAAVMNELQNQTEAGIDDGNSSDDAHNTTRATEIAVNVGYPVGKMTPDEAPALPLLPCASHGVRAGGRVRTR